ncbi:MAG TPA: hypothetical protein VNA17_06755, partial [Pyrinomonadaceae bacterium]|nr:hypothetical protein [Pyrinomonadaceae bacterium]
MAKTTIDTTGMPGIKLSGEEPFAAVAPDSPKKEKVKKNLAKPQPVIKPIMEKATRKKKAAAIDPFAAVAGPAPSTA